jgi:hypothetical protein
MLWLSNGSERVCLKEWRTRVDCRHVFSSKRKTFFPHFFLLKVAISTLLSRADDESREVNTVEKDWKLRLMFDRNCVAAKFAHFCFLLHFLVLIDSLFFQMLLVAANQILAPISKAAAKESAESGSKV